MDLASSAPPAPPVMPTIRIVVPAAMQGQLADATARGVSEATAWIAAHPGGTVDQLAAFVADHVGAPPTGQALEADHQAVLAAAAGRSPAQDETARWIDEHGLFEPWQPAIDAYVAKVGPAQARSGVELLERAKALTGVLTFPVKDRYVRERPFQAFADTPLLDGITHVRGGSFPSGHASLAVAQELVLASLLPECAVGARTIADEVCFARPYAAAHFPSDVVAGAYIGAVAATFAAARPDVAIPKRP